MSLITRFEDIKAWQEARKLVKMIYQLTGSGMLAKDFGLRDQIQRAAVSSMANIAEGFDCESKVDLHASWVLRGAQPSKFSHYSMPHLIQNILLSRSSKSITNRQNEPRHSLAVSNTRSKNKPNTWHSYLTRDT